MPKAETQAFQGMATKAGGELAVITCHFNWAKFVRPVQNLHRFLRQMKSMGIPTYGAEAYLPGQTPQTSGMPGWIQVEADPAHQIMFQKEALLNLAEQRVPDHFQKIAWLDADLMFSNQRWAEDTALLLNHFPVVQPFETAIWTDMDGREAFRKPSTMRVGGALPMRSHPGFAMAARRSIFKDIGGLYDRLIVGSGDMAAAVAILNTTMPTSQTYSDALMTDWTKWKDKLVSLAQGQFGWTPGMVWHEWHGDRALRQYSDRHKISALLDPRKHLTLASNGLLSWTGSATVDMRDYVANYFVSRQEDGVPTKN
jgi:hypothetical protein